MVTYMRCATIGIFLLSHLEACVLLGMTLIASVVRCVYLSEALTTQCSHEFLLLSMCYVTYSSCSVCMACGHYCVCIVMSYDR